MPEAEWLDATISRHDRLTKSLTTLMRTMLKERQIEFLDVTGRTKTVASAKEKIERKKYADPLKQITDLTGIRIITFLEAQVNQISNLLEELFDIDAENSMDRSKVLGSDRMGYRSSHFVCKLGEHRSGLAEYKGLTELKFEVQIRTVLQHAWAELAHDRSFKFGPGLPGAIQRKLNLYSGMLEVVDAGFDSIAKEIDDYVSSLSERRGDEIKKTEIDRLSLREFYKYIRNKHGIKLRNSQVNAGLINEIRSYGIRDIGSLTNLITPEFLNDLKESGKSSDTTMYGFIRALLMYSDLDKYLAGPRDWLGATSELVELLDKKWGRETVRSKLSDHGIHFVNYDG